MVRDIVTLKSNKDLVTEYLSENQVRVIGDDVTITKDSVYFDTGPAYKIGQRSNFRGLNKFVRDFVVEVRKENTVMVLLELGD